MSARINPKLSSLQVLSQSRLIIKSKNQVIVHAKQTTVEQDPRPVAASRTMLKQQNSEVDLFKLSEMENSKNKKRRPVIQFEQFVQNQNKIAQHKTNWDNLGQRKQKGSFSCEICCRSLNQSSQVILHCGHQFCQECLLMCAAENLGASKHLKCPNDLCRRLIDLKLATYLQKLPPHLHSKYKRYALSLTLINKADEAICPNQQCEQGTIQIQNPNTKAQFPKQTKCSKCGVQVCNRCLMPPHQAYIACKSWKNEFSEIKDMKNFCQCEKCGNIIEKSEGCNHMTCSCDYQFCFVCNGRWRQFHLCSPFSYQTHRNTSAQEERAEPGFKDYAQYVLIFVGKIFWAIFTVIYIFPFLIAGYILAILGLVLGLLLMGMTYGYGCLIKDSIQNNSIVKVLGYIILFPLGMAMGIYRTFSSYPHLFFIVCKSMLKVADLCLPFNWIPFQLLV